MNFTTATSRTISVYEITQELIACYAQANNKQQHFINDVPADMFIPRKSSWLAPLVGDMMEIISHREKDSVVRITASYYRNKPQLQAC